MRPNGSPQILEHRRRKALALLKQGLTIGVVARCVGADFSSVYRWQQRVAQDGPEALRAQPVSGRPRKLGKKECRTLLAILLKGALASGFSNDLWTLKRIASVIRRKFGVKFHPNHVWRLLRREGGSCQIPEKRALERNDAAIAHWKHYQWPAIKKTPKTWGPPGLH
jgi:transposase